eukprot:TRINITY_DN658_c0_g2_i1.p1 TRINITY_DN658_c0_g2~~TRINITY_DN658_c0_g2_i1.p1  ORF type:complete len:616 (-),score=218.04 TRINITY_DN658_c0_g2_i1:93-1940(-)
MMDLKKKYSIGKKTGHRRKVIDKAEADYKNFKTEADNEGRPNWPAIELINDPHGYTKKVFGMLKHNKEAFNIRILIMNFISRLISCHSVILFGFYSYMQRYLKPHQQHIAHLMAITAQACHEMVPPDAMEPVIRTIANEFITERCLPEAIALGLNTVRAICEKCPLAMPGELLRDLTLYRKEHHKAVVSASRSLLQLFRQKHPGLLRTKERGKLEQMVEPLAYGAVQVHTDVAGIEVLGTKGATKHKSVKESDLRDVSDEVEEVGKEKKGEDEEKEEKGEKEVDEGKAEVEEKEGADDDEEESSLSDYEVVEEHKLEDEDQEGTNEAKEKKGGEDESESESEEEDGEDESEEEEEEEEDADGDEDGEEEEDEDEDEEEEEAEAEEEEEVEVEDEVEEKKEQGKKPATKEKEEKKIERKRKHDDVFGDTASEQKRLHLDDTESYAYARACDQPVGLGTPAAPAVPVAVEAKASASRKRKEPEHHGILSQEDFDRIRRHQREQVNESSSEEEEGPFHVISAEDLEVVVKRKKTREERMEGIKEMKAERGKKFERERGRSNKVKARNKNFIMKLVGQRRQLNIKAETVRRSKNRKPDRKQQHGHQKKMFGKNQKGSRR